MNPTFVLMLLRTDASEGGTVPAWRAVAPGVDVRPADIALIPLGGLLVDLHCPPANDGGAAHATVENAIALLCAELLARMGAGSPTLRVSAWDGGVHAGVMLAWEENTTNVAVDARACGASAPNVDSSMQSPSGLPVPACSPGPQSVPRSHSRAEPA